VGTLSPTLAFIPSYQHSERIGMLLRDHLERRRERRNQEREEEQRQKADYQPGRTHFYVSEIGTVQGEAACDRKVFYEWNNAPKDPLSHDSLLNFEFGDMLELRVRNILAEEGAVEKVQLPLTFDPHPVSGRLDVLLRPQEKALVEVKTATLKQRNYLPKADHIAQANLYVHRARELPEYDWLEGAILYYAFKDPAKGQPVDLEFSIPYDAMAAETALSAFDRAYRVAKGAALPDRPQGFTPSRFPCSYCSFLSVCWSGIPKDEAPF